MHHLQAGAVASAEGRTGERELPGLAPRTGRGLLRGHRPTLRRVQELRLQPQAQWDLEGGVCPEVPALLGGLLHARGS